MKLAILYDIWKEEAGELAREINTWLIDRGMSTLITHLPVKEVLERLADDSYIALLLGGDGFITRNALQLAKKKVPLLGINFGTVGFLAAVQPERWQEGIEKLLAGQYTIKREKLLKGLFRGEEFDAVNDIVLFRGLQKFVRMRVEVDGHEVFGDIGGDGIIISSSMGSTAYNLSAGGPIIETGVAITPLAVHKLNVSPLALEDNRVVEVTCVEGSRCTDDCFVLEVDGDNSRRVVPGDKFKVWCGDLETIFIIPEGFIFIKALQDKLGLSR